MFALTKERARSLRDIVEALPGVSYVGEPNALVALKDPVFAGMHWEPIGEDGATITLCVVLSESWVNAQRRAAFAAVAGADTHPDSPAQYADTTRDGVAHAIMDLGNTISHTVLNDCDFLNARCFIEVRMVDVHADDDRPDPLFAQQDSTSEDIQEQ